MPVNNSSSTTTSNKWWYKFKPLIFSSPAEVAQFIVEHPESVPTFLNKKRPGSFSLRNFRNEILNDPIALGVILVAKSKLNLSGDFLEEAVNINFNQQVNNINELAAMGVNAIGIDKGENYTDSDTLAPYPFVEDLTKQFRNENEKVILHKTTAVKDEIILREVIRLGGDCYYFVQDELPVGISQHKEIPWLYASLSPEFAEENKIDTALDYVKKTTKAIDANHSGKKQIIFVLGKREDNENNKLYSQYTEQVSYKGQTLIRAAIQQDKAGLTSETETYYIQAEGAEKLNLDSQALDSLYDAIDECRRGEATLRIHCRQGVDRTGVFVFAAQLLNKFDYIFSGTEQEIAAKIAQEHMILRESRGPNILKFVPYFQVSIRLAFVLKAVEQQRKCESALQKIYSETANGILINLKAKGTIEQQKDYLSDLIGKESDASKKASLNNLLAAIINRDIAEKSLQAMNHFKESYTKRMAMHFARFMFEGAATEAKGTKGVNIIATELEQLIDYWKDIANKAGFSNELWFKDRLAAFTEQAKKVFAVKKQLDEYVEQFVKATTYEEKQELVDKINQLPSLDVAKLKTDYTNGFSELKDHKMLMSFLELESKKLFKLKESKLKSFHEGLKYPQLQDSLEQLQPIDKEPLQKGHSAVSAVYYNDLKYVVSLLEAGKLATDNSQQTKDAIARIFSDDELEEYDRGELSNKIKEELFNAIKSVRPVNTTVEPVPQSTGEKSQEVINLNLIDFDDTLVVFDDNNQPLINQKVLAKINENTVNQSNIIFTQRGVGLTKRMIADVSDPSLSIINAIKQLEKLKIKGVKVSSSYDRFFTAGKALSYFKNAIERAETELSITPNSPVVQEMVKSENQLFVDRGIEQPKGKIRHYTHLLEQLGEANPGKSFNVTLMDDSVDNLKEINSYFDRMEALHALGLAKMPSDRPKLVWVSNAYHLKQLQQLNSEVIKIVKSIIEAADPRQIDKLFANHEKDILSSLEALELLVANSAKSPEIKAFLLKNYLEIEKKYINNHKIITTLDFERDLKEIVQNIRLEPQERECFQQLVKLLGAENARLILIDMYKEGITTAEARIEQLNQFIANEVLLQHSQLTAELKNNPIDLARYFAELLGDSQVLDQANQALANMTELGDKESLLAQKYQTYKEAKILSQRVQILCKMAPFLTEHQLKSIVKIEVLEGKKLEEYRDELVEHYYNKLQGLNEPILEYQKILKSQAPAIIANFGDKIKQLATETIASIHAKKSKSFIDTMQQVKAVKAVLAGEKPTTILSSYQITDKKLIQQLNTLAQLVERFNRHVAGLKNIGQDLYASDYIKLFNVVNKLDNPSAVLMVLEGKLNPASLQQEGVMNWFNRFMRGEATAVENYPEFIAEQVAESKFADMQQEQKLLAICFPGIKEDVQATLLKMRKIMSLSVAVSKKAEQDVKKPAISVDTERHAKLKEYRQHLREFNNRHNSFIKRLAVLLPGKAAAMPTFDLNMFVTYYAGISQVMQDGIHNAAHKTAHSLQREMQNVAREFTKFCENMVQGMAEVQAKISNFDSLIPVDLTVDNLAANNKMTAKLEKQHDEIMSKFNKLLSILPKEFREYYVAVSNKHQDPTMHSIDLIEKQLNDLSDRLVSNNLIDKNGKNIIQVFKNISGNLAIAEKKYKQFNKKREELSFSQSVKASSQLVENKHSVPGAGGGVKDTVQEAEASQLIKRRNY